MSEKAKTDNLGGDKLETQAGVGEGNHAACALVPVKILTERQRNWVRGYNGAFRREDLPQGVCNTVYYIRPDGVQAHFTPGRAPKKRITAYARRNFNYELPTIPEPADENDDKEEDTDAEDVEIPMALE